MPELIKLTHIQTKKLSSLVELIKEIWSECFLEYVNKEILEYIVGFLNIENLKYELKEQNFEYFFINFKNQNVGFIALEYLENIVNISRFYIKKEFRNLKIGSKAFLLISKIVKENKSRKIILFLNQKNKKAIKFFEKFGFVRKNPTIRNIGSNYFFEEFKMELNL